MMSIYCIVSLIFWVFAMFFMAHLLKCCLRYILGLGCPGRRAQQFATTYLQPEIQNQGYSQQDLYACPQQPQQWYREEETPCRRKRSRLSKHRGCGCGQ